MASGREVPRRLFVAVEVPVPAQDALDALIGPWRERFPDVRWSPRGNRHVTIRFLGATPPPLVGHVIDGVRAAARTVERFGVALAGCGRFPARGRARVLWVGLEDRGKGLPALAGAVGEHLPAVLEPETRPFAAHLTVARPAPSSVVAGWEDARPDPAGWTVGELLLFESHLGRPHARYEVVGRFPLADVAGPTSDPR